MRFGCGVPNEGSALSRGFLYLQRKERGIHRRNTVYRPENASHYSLQSQLLPSMVSGRRQASGNLQAALCSVLDQMNRLALIARNHKCETSQALQGFQTAPAGAPTRMKPTPLSLHKLQPQALTPAKQYSAPLTAFHSIQISREPSNLFRTPDQKTTEPATTGTSLSTLFASIWSATVSCCHSSLGRKWLWRWTSPGFRKLAPRDHFVVAVGRECPRREYILFPSTRGMSREFAW